MSVLARLSIRFRLSAAIAVLFGLILLVSLIGMRVLERTEVWMDSLHQNTLTEVSDALELSRRSAELAASAPFLFALFPPFQLQHEAQSVLGNLQRIEEQAAGDPALDLPLSRLRIAIEDLTSAQVPQTARKAALTAIDRDMVRLNQRVRHLSGDTARTLAERAGWAQLQQLTANAIGAIRADTLIELGEFSSRFAQDMKTIRPQLLPAHQVSLDEIQAVLTRHGDSLFVLKHREVAADLDAENALFRIRQETGRINEYAAERVAQAENRLSLARAETSSNLDIAINSFVALTLMSLLVAIASALFVSRYVARNLRRIADAMRRLAAGDHRSGLPKGPSSEDEIGQLFAAFHVFRDNARKLDRRTGQIRRQNALFSRVFRNIKDGVAVTSADGWIEAENGSLRSLLRLPPPPEDTPHRMQDLIAQSAFARNASAGERGGFEEYGDSSGHVLEMRHSPLPDGGAVWLLSETTERKRVEERLEEIRRVEALGKVAGEVAHDFGNILSSISGNLHLLKGADAEQARHLRTRIGSALDLGVSLTERLLAFARKQHLEPQVTDVVLLVEGMADLLEIALPASVPLQFDLAADPVLARVDPGQLESAILNLCVNASQAIDGAGTIRVSVTAGADGGAQLCIQDDGCGMTPEVLQRAAEPFFTNRSDGSGTGLGLSMVDGFVHQSGGHLDITSRPAPPDRGTTVMLTFPPLMEEPAQTAALQTPGAALVIDDDPAYLASAANVLEHLGYTVHRAATFAEGSAQLRQQSDLDLVLSDLNLENGASGWDLLQLGHGLHPECQLILMSTRQIQRVPDTLRSAPRLATLAKPVTENAVRSLIASW